MDKEVAVCKFYRKDYFHKNDYKNFLNLLSDLHKHLKDFLVWKTIRAQGEEQDRLLMEIYRKNDLDQNYLATIEKSDKMIDQRKALSCTDFYHRMVLNDAIYYNPKLKKVRNKGNHLIKAMEALDQFYVATKLKYICELWSRTEVFEEEYRVYLIDAIESFQEEKAFVKTSLHIMYQKVFLLLKEKNHEVYLDLKNFLLREYRQVSVKDGFILLNHLLNYIAHQLRKGKVEFWQESFDLHRFGLESGLLLKEAYFTPIKFLNIVDSAVAVKELDWAKNFIENYVEYLPKARWGNTKRNALARIFFEKGAYEESIQILLQIPIDNYFHSLRVRLLLLRNYYEAEERFEIILREISNFERFLSRNGKVNIKLLLAYKNFLRLFKKLVLRKMKKESLIKSIKQTQPILLKDWLLAKTVKYTSWKHR